MRTVAKLTLVEMKLFIREPVTMFFTFALPLLFLFIMGGVFGNKPDTTGITKSLKSYMGRGGFEPPSN